MSHKSKNLSYEAQEPAFLRRLRAQQAGVDTDRHERPLARPRRVKVDTGDDEAPTYVDEASNDVLSKEEYEALLRSERNSNSMTDKEGVPAKTNGEITSAKKQTVAEVGTGQRKKKSSARIVAGADTNKVYEKKEKDGITKKKAKKSIKGIKLAFEADE